jgi:hypothetical protein
MGRSTFSLSHCWFLAALRTWDIVVHIVGNWFLAALRTWDAVVPIVGY